MTPEHEQHLADIKTWVTAALDAKYRKGQDEHGGTIWHKQGMLAHAEEEVLDLLVYLRTLRQQIDRLAGPAEN